MNRENGSLCFVFPMGIEAYPFLQRVEVKSRRRRGHAVYRDAFFEGTRFSIVRCGIGPERAAAAMKNVEAKPGAIISVGTAGALVQDLKYGDMTISSQTVFGHCPDDVLHWPDTLVSALARACVGAGVPHKIVRLATVKEAVLHPQGRLSLHERTGAQAVDMESHAIGMAAREMGVPFTSLRVISDDFSSPPITDRRGLKKIWQEPSQILPRLKAGLRWWVFVRNFHSAVHLLHPVLVRLIRDWAEGRT